MYKIIIGLGKVQIFVLVFANIREIKYIFGIFFCTEYFKVCYIILFATSLEFFFAGVNCLWILANYIHETFV